MLNKNHKSRLDDISKVNRWNRRKVTSGSPQQIVQASAWRNARALSK